MALRMEAPAGPDDLAAARDGDAAAFSRVVGVHYAFIHRIAWRWTGSREDAEDVSQEVCIRLARGIRGWRGEAAFTSFLYTLTLNAVRDLARRRGCEKRLAGALHMQALVEGEAGGDPECDPAQALWLAVRELPDKQRDAVLLVHGEGLSHAQAGEAMGCSEKTVSWHIFEARKRLKLALSAGGMT